MIAILPDQAAASPENGIFLEPVSGIRTAVIRLIPRKPGPRDLRAGPFQKRNYRAFAADAGAAVESSAESEPISSAAFFIERSFT